MDYLVLKSLSYFDKIGLFYKYFYDFDNTYFFVSVIQSGIEIQ